jgi:Glycine rich protein
VLATFNSAGSYTWTVPSLVKRVTFDVYGASGGNVVDGSTLLATGGRGGEAKGQLSVKPGQVFEVVVGGRGGDNNGYLGGPGGFNGGGVGGFQDGSCCGAGGGGAGWASGTGITGGAGGGVAGTDVGGRGGHQTEGGIQDPNWCTGDARADGSFGAGGDAANCVVTVGIAGGGGGWFGGVAGLGGGGSGYLSHFTKSGSFPGGTRQGDGLVVISTP